MDASSRHQGAAFFFFRQMLPPYTKPHLSFADQVALLIQRGLGVTDQAKATDHLRRIGYGRLCPYLETFQQLVPDPTDSSKTIRSPQFQAGAEFRHAVDLYLFDKQLRILFLDAIERIEVALRVDLAHTLGKRNPWAHRSVQFLDSRRATIILKHSGRPRHDVWLDKADEAIRRSQEEWVAAFFNTYSSELPIWMAVETWDFGTLSWLLEMAHPNDRSTIAKQYGLLPDTLVSWIRCLAGVRNLSAHHSRLWNTGMVNQPAVPKPFEAATLVHIGTAPVQRTRVYGAAAVASYLVKKLSARTSWSGRMRDHWIAFPRMPLANATQGGFLAGWNTLPIWT
ncbi:MULTISPECIES: Abi family protein [Acetobacteraceae]|nr:MULTISPECIES: Abi family protein [Acetobacteraceae]MCW4578935.1 Abi family protein [Gluconacetobacter entanii]MCW4582334.1 Abi family protein [Gluconacetobacter entanii]MCW4585717.1 Abi family protein [Gluconacetobacter entanii]WEQ54332.1 Abi family protein [Komagataeibacter nataicola]